ncbi:hypothetical protein KBB96_09490 [Luteolibacter ambystomatis]|uniref:Trimeric autotransporter adhesin YadA-like head domain-containing protein n=1 Tax=Luteolibacter ambystomatis TaxID=2824561 RepID=A0A975PHA0_9BACT|nr:hypothetical protein [Luteolibacter ambystomatis]QUE53112.1 hypothetical protein KBB96_09490 [Luteolibacter ambystomatis]
MKPRFFRSVLPLALVISMPPLAKGGITDTDLSIGSSNTVTASSGAGAFGQGNTVSDKSVAIGYNSEASGKSIAVGSGSHATDRSAAFGNGTYADEGSLATGFSVQAYKSSLAAGSNVFLSSDTRQTFASGDTISVYHAATSGVIGTYNGINLAPYDENAEVSAGSESDSFIAGYSNLILRGVSRSGRANVLLGQYNIIDTTAAGFSQYEASVLLGSNNTSSQTESWALGKGNIAQTRTVTLGTYNATVSDASLIIGNGTSDSVRSNALVVLKNGNVVIPGGSLTIGSETAMTPTSVGSYLTTNKYLTRQYGTGSTLSGGGLLAIGDGAYATGSRSIALGSSSSSTGTGSVALGDNAQALAMSSAALGVGSIAEQAGSLALGNSANALGTYSVALNAIAGGNYSFAATNGIPEGVGATAIGAGYAVGDGSIAIGGWDMSVPGYPQGSTSLGVHSTAIGGLLATAEGDYTFASGYMTNATAAYSTVLGSSNRSASGLYLAPVDLTTWRDNEVLFELGNGEPDHSPAQYSNAITTLKNGRTTLTNKYWVSTTPTVVPSSTDATSGTALAVEGHTDLKGNAQVAGKTTLNGETTVNGKTVLNGEVIMANAQGDISMGIYE